jgi:hypothetical protein
MVSERNKGFLFLKRISTGCVLSIFLLGVSVSASLAQAEVMAWGNITGIRLDGQLMEFETSLGSADADWNQVTKTAKERQRPQYHREGNLQTVHTGFGGRSFSGMNRSPDIAFTQVVKDITRGTVEVKVHTTVNVDTTLGTIFFQMDVPADYFTGGSIRSRLGSFLTDSEIHLKDLTSRDYKDPYPLNADGLLFRSNQKELIIDISPESKVYLRKEISGNANLQVMIELLGGKISAGTQSEKTIILVTEGDIDHSPVDISLNVNRPGQKFEGLGGNFRLQNPETDPAVIQYCLDNMRVAWGRVEMPWNFWHPEEAVDPVEAARNGNLDPRVKGAMEMAQRLAAIGMPVIISDWSAPAWAILGDPKDAFANRARGIYGYPLNPDKTEKIYESIADYVEYMKNMYGVEAVLFSFNESDLGINVRHTGEEHAEFIKGLGAHLASKGLATKLLLGDNSDATTFDFIVPAMKDPETHKYIGALSFHSWRGCTDENLKKWAGAARKMNLPLLVGEGSTDAAAWNYPEIFSESSFALHEINLYIRICAVCQPLSILQWQLTADYSLLTGNGIFGTQGPLKPTQRFWNLKQLASTPEEAFAIPLTCNKETIQCAAFGNIARNTYAVHMVNNGAECPVTIHGIPPGITGFTVFVTNARKQMEQLEPVEVIDGVAKINLTPAGFTTLISQ